MDESGSTHARIDFSKLSVVFGHLAGSNADIERQLGILGIKSLRVGADYDRLCRSIEKDKPDLVLCGMNPGQATAHLLMRGIRHQDIGNNPFPVLISLAPALENSECAPLIDTGIDSILTAPFSRDGFVRQVNELAFERKKFVATPSYIGPTRRKLTRTESGTGEEFDVPNPVHASGTGVPKEELWQQIAAATTSLNARKLTNDVAMIRRLVYEIMPDYEAGNITPHFERRVAALHDIVTMIHRRALRLSNRNLVSMCELSNNVLGEIRQHPTPPNLKHLKAMPKLVNGFQTALLTIPERRALRGH